MIRTLPLPIGPAQTRSQTGNPCTATTLPVLARDTYTRSSHIASHLRTPLASSVSSASNVDRLRPPPTSRSPSRARCGGRAGQARRSTATAFATPAITPSAPHQSSPFSSSRSPNRVGVPVATPPRRHRTPGRPASTRAARCGGGASTSSRQAACTGARSGLRALHPC